ncbi:glutamate racemase [Paenibacillus sp. M1]|uniref:Glutamate racemase n=1 Tax=Paenibacillus haidiansis TaxID=1574488 RepID=A0ABU7VPC5_9BACL
MRIAFFDSGLGGLTVLSAAMKKLPKEDFLFYADTLHVPYGSKPGEAVKQYIHESVKTIMREEVKAIVVACNTATSLAIAELRSMYDIPVIGMEPAVKPAVEQNRATGKRVLVFATPLTLKEAKYIDLVKRVDDMNIVDSIPLPELVQYCEALNFDKGVIADYLAGKLDGVDLNQYGTVVLGCTHYPFYGKLLADILPPHIQIIDGRTGTVNRLVQVLKARHLLSAEGQEDLKFLCSSNSVQYIEKMKEALSLLNRMEGESENDDW